MGMHLTRMDMADFTAVYKGLWGGVRFGADNHSRKRSLQRYHKFMSYNLLVDNLAEVMKKGGDALELQVLSLKANSSFVVFDEEFQAAYFCSLGVAPDHMVEVFIHSVYVRKNNIVWCRPDQALFKVWESGAVSVNPPELCRKKK